MANNPLSAISSLWSSCTTEVIVAIASLIFLKTPSLLPLADLESGCLRQVCYKKLTVINYKSSKETECNNMKKWPLANCFFIQGNKKISKNFHVTISHLPLKLSVASWWTFPRLTSLPPFQLLKCHLLNPGSSETKKKIENKQTWSKKSMMS